MMTPPVRSPCPPRYFVVACTTRSAPSSNGDWPTGVATVLSQTQRAPAPCASVASARMSDTFHIGFDGVSTHTTRVVGRNARSTSARSVMSTNVVSSPQRVKVSRSNRPVP